VGTTALRIACSAVAEECPASPQQSEPECADPLLWSVDVRIAPILLKKSKIAKLRNSRECRMLVISAAARLCRIDTSVGGRFCADRCGPSHRSARDARAALRVFSHQPKGLFQHNPPKATIFGRQAFVPKRRSRHSSTAALISFKNENGQAARSPRLEGQPLNHPSHRLRPVVPWWSRAAGIAARDDAAPAGPNARKDRGRAWIAVPPDR
jgi:hypothetical protein